LVSVLISAKISVLVLGNVSVWAILTDMGIGIKQWPLAPNSQEWQITRANVARQVTFFSKMAFGKSQGVWRVRATWLGECRRVSHISENGRFGEYSHSPKMVNFRGVLKFAKFAGE
jgi:hypothetical protein